MQHTLLLATKENTENLAFSSVCSLGDMPIMNIKRDKKELVWHLCSPERVWNKWRRFNEHQEAYNINQFNNYILLHNTYNVKSLVQLEDAF